MRDPAPSSSAVIDVHQVRHAFGPVPVLDGVSFSLPAGGLAALLGPSGCGKTTLLRLAAGLEVLQAGTITLAGTPVSTPHSHVPPERRRVGMVFQDFALFPHLTVARNIAFGLHAAAPGLRQARVAELLALTGLTGLGERYPHMLSGGQQQRVSLARALAPRPPLVLLDEPFSGLDVSLRTSLAGEIRDVLVQEGTAAILVTHDQHEAFAFADEVGVMEAGRLAQWGTPETLYQRPASRTVAEFIGEGAWLPGEFREGRAWCELGPVPGELRWPHDGMQGAGAWDLRLRPEAIVPDAVAACIAIVESHEFRGATTLCRLLLPSGRRILASIASDPPPQPGQPLAVGLRPMRYAAFPAAGTANSLGEIRKHS